MLTAKRQDRAFAYLAVLPACLVLAALAGVFLATFVLLNVMLHMMVIRRVTRLAAIADQVSLGNLDAGEFKSRSKDEIGVLTEAPGNGAALGTSVADLTVAVLDRPRHTELVDRIRRAGARVRLLPDGDVAAAIAAARPTSGIDMAMGIGGTPEGILAAAAVRCLGGTIQAQLTPRDAGERGQVRAAGHDTDRVLHTTDLVGGANVFFAATGVTDGPLLRGVRYFGGNRAGTQSIVMRSKSGTVRIIEAEHRLDFPGPHSEAART